MLPQYILSKKISHVRMRDLILLKKLDNYLYLFLNTNIVKSFLNPL